MSLDVDLIPIFEKAERIEVGIHSHLHGFGLVVMDDRSRFSSISCLFCDFDDYDSKEYTKKEKMIGLTCDLVIPTSSYVRKRARDAQ